MIHRIVVRAKQRDKESPLEPRIVAIERLASWVVVPILIGFALHKTSKLNSSVRGQQLQLKTYGGHVSPLIPILGVCFIVSICWALYAFYFYKIYNSRRREGVAVTIYHIGVQLTRISIQDDGTKVIAQERTARFFPRDQIIDCIVTEVVLVHKVQSVVILRLGKLKMSNNTSSESINLVNAFPGMELTYMECCTLRNEINTSMNILKQEKSNSFD